jgi:nicotinamide mononucleotide adenylyltransferase
VDEGLNRGVASVTVPASRNNLIVWLQAEVEYSVMKKDIFNQSLNTPLIEKYLICQNVE